MHRPACRPIRDVQPIRLRGVVADLVRGLIDQWLLIAPQSNPAMLEMFRDRDAPPLRNVVPWAGEFAGKYLTGAVEVLRLTGDGRLYEWLQTFVAHLLSFQDEDGYLGPWPRPCRLANRDLAGERTWDTWGHYHVMMGLIKWYGETGDQAALGGATRIADLICETYLGARLPRLVDTPDTDKNLAPVHALCLLYRVTKRERYLDMARQIVDEFGAQGADGPLAGDYVRLALQGKAFHELPKPRWESLHAIMGLAELCWIDGSEEFGRAFRNLWWSMLAGDRHNNGGFTSGEKATGNPYDLNPIETCCTIAWIATSIEMLKLTGYSRVADEIELATLNSAIGMHSPTGRWATYNTPMNGIRRASAHSIVFQAREGSPELNCCSVNSPRGLGLISEWGMMRDDEGLIINWYGPSTTAPLPFAGGSLSLEQETDYPRSGRVCLAVTVSRPTRACLKLRIPYWSRKTRVRVGGELVPGVQAGSYLALEREWRAGDVIELDLDMSLHYWVGERECQGRASVYRGPILLAMDHRYNLALASERRLSVRELDEWMPVADALPYAPRLNAAQLDLVGEEWDSWMPPQLLFTCRATNGQLVRLCDFASAGAGGTPYQTWLQIEGLPGPCAFSASNPLRSQRAISHR